jgi:hypothetical protein
MTKLENPVTRVTTKRVSGRDVVVTLAPMHNADPVFYFRLMGTRTSYPLSLSDAYRYAALIYGQKAAQARRQARREGIPWARAKRQFAATMSPPVHKRDTPVQEETT